MRPTLELPRLSLNERDRRWFIGGKMYRVSASARVCLTMQPRWTESFGVNPIQVRRRTRESDKGAQGFL